MKTSNLSCKVFGDIPENVMLRSTLSSFVVLFKESPLLHPLPLWRAGDRTVPLSLEMVLSLGSTTSSLVPKLVRVKMRRCGLLDRTRDMVQWARGRRETAVAAFPFAEACTFCKQP